MYKRDTKVICKGEQWYYIGQDSAGDHLLSKEKGYTGTNTCTDPWFNKYAWTHTTWAYKITSVEPIPSPLENAIEEYKREHGVVGTRPFKVLLEAPQRYPSTWLRFNGTTLEYEHINGWNKALASDLCEILFNTYEFLYLKGGEPTTPVLFKVGDKVIVEWNGKEIEGTIVVFNHHDGTYLLHSPLIDGHNGGTQNNNNNWWHCKDEMRLHCRQDWSEHVE